MLKPLNKNIVLKKEEVENKTASGIILTTETKSLPTVGEVVAVGPQCENDLKEKIVLYSRNTQVQKLNLMVLNIL